MTMLATVFAVSNLMLHGIDDLPPRASAEFLAMASIATDLCDDLKADSRTLAVLSDNLPGSFGQRRQIIEAAKGTFATAMLGEPPATICALLWDALGEDGEAIPGLLLRKEP
ncbi:hypothetical protein [Jiella marina]|uniref:hypothetical protein n=1 Tax=Jiella sp. LLJ827 TaxID=2917712 RepID=UPI00210081A2|nr:hypothetical protein [Jiella sp. LLJ827]MCQ0986400.1 hypothetical protein [Jiella sp. LLJ827]